MVAGDGVVRYAMYHLLLGLVCSYHILPWSHCFEDISTFSWRTRDCLWLEQSFSLVMTLKT